MKKIIKNVLFNLVVVEAEETFHKSGTLCLKKQSMFFFIV